MSKVRGVLLIMAGAGVAAYILSAGIQFGRQAPSQHINVATSPAAAVQLAVVSEPERTGSPQGESAAVVSVPRPADVPRVLAFGPPPPPSAGPGPASRAWPPYVTHARRGGAPPRLPLSLSSEPDNVPGNRASLTRALQRELRRVGCYGGEVNGGWTKSTRRAMKAFTDRVNASLPLEEPDHVLLALVKNYPDDTCERPCPEGQGMSETGRCLPNAILTRTETKGSTGASAGVAPGLQAPVIIGRSTTTTEPPPEGRMALAGPRLEGRSLSPAEPMSNAGVSLLRDADRIGQVAPGQRSPKHVGKSHGNSWARSFWKRRRDTF